MPIDSTELQSVLEGGDVDQCVQIFQSLSERERSSVAKQCLNWYRQIVDQLGKRLAADQPDQLKHALPVAQVAVHGACSFSDLKKLGWQARPQEQYLFEILRDRRPAWIDKFVEMVLNEEWYWHHWSYVRSLVREGICPAPDHPHYILGMVGGLTSASSAEVIVEKFREDSQLLEHEIWRLFEIEGVGENSLANHDRWSETQPWKNAFCQLVSDGDLPRERVLDACLDALQRDFNQYQSRWYAGLHDALKPTSEEQRERAERYLALLDSKISVTVSWAFQIVELLDQQQPLEVRPLISALNSVLHARQKGIVKKTLKFCERIVKRDRSSADSVVQMVAEGLAHEDVSVQEAALQFIEKYGEQQNDSVKETIASFEDIVAPSLRSRLAEWIGDGNHLTDAAPSVATSVALDLSDYEQRIAELDAQLSDAAGLNQLLEFAKSGEGPIPAASFDGTEYPRLDPELRLQPIADLEELFDVCARVLEEPTLVDEAERAFDGFSRLCGEKPENLDALIGPLLKRSIQKMKRFGIPFVGGGPEKDLGGIVISWSRGELIRGKPAARREELLEFCIEGDILHCSTEFLERPLGFLSRRSSAIAERMLHGISMPLLSAPTHGGGWIDPRTLAERVNCWIDEDREPDLYDVCLALLRTAPENRSAALSLVKPSNREWVDAVRYALGAEKIRIGKNPAFWACAARMRTPWSDDAAVLKAHPKPGPDAGEAARYRVEVKPASKSSTASVRVETEPALPSNAASCSLPTKLHNRSRHWSDPGPLGGSSAATVRWAATIWPVAMEAYFATALERLVINFDWWEASWHHKHYLEPLLNADVPLKPIATLTLATALGVKEPGEYGLAVDAAIAAIEDGRLDGFHLGEAMSVLLPIGLIKTARWVKTLGDVARISPLHAQVVRVAIERCLRGDPGQAPRDLQALLTFWKELCIESGEAVADSVTREFLSQIKGSGKAAKLAKTLLALEPQLQVQISAKQAALQIALESRIRRVENWAGR